MIAHIAIAGVIATTFLLFTLNQSLYFASLPIIKVVAAQLVTLKVYDLGGVKLSPNELIGGATFLIAITCFTLNLPRGMQIRHLRGIFITITAFSVWCFSVSIASIRPITALVETAKILGWMMLIPVIGFYINTPYKLRKIRRAGLLCYIIVVLNIVIANILNIGRNVSDFYVLTMRGPYIGYFTQPAELSLTLGSSLMFLLLRVKSKNSTVSPISLSTICLVLVGIAIMVALMVRTPVIVFTLAIMLTLLIEHSPNESNRRSLLMILILMLAIGVGTVYMITNYQEFVAARFKDVTEALGRGKTRSIGSGRYGLLEFYLQMIVNRDIVQLLTGFDVVGNIGLDYKPIVGSHNDWVDITFKFGLIGISIYFVFFVILIRNIYRRWKNVSEPSEKNLLSIAGVLCLTYIALSFHGMLFYQYAMHASAIIIGIALGSLGSKSAVKVVDN